MVVEVHRAVEGRDGRSSDRRVFECLRSSTSRSLDLLHPLPPFIRFLHLHT